MAHFFLGQVWKKVFGPWKFGCLLGVRIEIESFNLLSMAKLIISLNFFSSIIAPFYPNFLLNDFPTQILTPLHFTKCLLRGQGKIKRFFATGASSWGSPGRELAWCMTAPRIMVTHPWLIDNQHRIKNECKDKIFFDHPKGLRESRMAVESFRAHRSSRQYRRSQWPHPFHGSHGDADIRSRQSGSVIHPSPTMATTWPCFSTLSPLAPSLREEVSLRTLSPILFQSVPRPEHYPREHPNFRYALLFDLMDGLFGPSLKVSAIEMIPKRRWSNATRREVNPSDCFDSNSPFARERFLSFLLQHFRTPYDHDLGVPLNLYAFPLKFRRLGVRDTQT